LEIKFVQRLTQFPAPVRIVVLLLAVVLGWLPIAAPIALLVRDPNWVTILTMPLMFVFFLVMVRFWGRWAYQEKQIFWRYGLELTHQNGAELLIGLGIGLVSLFSLFLVQSLFGWVSWQPTSMAPLKLVLEGLLVGLGVGFIEELVFRGWVLDELQRDYGPSTALWANSLIFACLHFVKPLPVIVQTSPQFFGLILLGLALVWAKRSTRSRVWSTISLSVHDGRLGLPIGLHAGLVGGYYVVNVGQLVRYSERVPQWITGIHNNPLAGLVGLVFLLGLGVVMRSRVRSHG
jgi:hypothetical protein